MSRRTEDAVQAALELWVARERRRSLAAVDIAKAAIDRGEGAEITRESVLRSEAMPRQISVLIICCIRKSMNSRTRTGSCRP